ncbi:hypothetical protein RhiXN_08529 [Rhizoctonia solani]|uniref:DNA damage-responsive protein 48 n=1 Tax=Rhizoctonia solani TaxID=456999 RepID=A0A8H8P2M4_9AGAM|nr:uncharacterized protein RhiXN_08529 [Rhizoctonia solani]QRW23493.1 hypothetical protein RhiXN_08529 [Rhizoctonia solani]
MDFLNKFAGQHTQQNPDQGHQQAGGSGGFMGMINNAAGGGQAGEAKEDGLYKAIDWVQEKYLGQGDQSNESALEQAKDEQISDFIRAQYKSATGKDFPIADK